MPAFSIYTVQQGDTLEDIAQRHGVTWQVLARLNGLIDPDSLYPGQRIRVPREERRPPRGGVYTVQQGDTLGSIAARFGTTVPVLLRLNGLQNSELIYPGQELRVPAAPPAGNGWYEVQPGDTLYSLAGRFGTTGEELAQLNGIGTPNLIFPGERLRLPRQVN